MWGQSSRLVTVSHLLMVLMMQWLENCLNFLAVFWDLPRTSKKTISVSYFLDPMMISKKAMKLNVQDASWRSLSVKNSSDVYCIHLGSLSTAKARLAQQKQDLSKALQPELWIVNPLMNLCRPASRRLMHLYRSDA